MEDFACKLNFSTAWTASSLRGLNAVLQQDAEFYKKLDGLPVNFRVDNGNVVVLLDQFDDDPGDVGAISPNRFLPNTTSAEGQILINLVRADQHDLAEALIYAFFVENGWIKNPFSNVAIRGSNFAQPQAVQVYLRGLALLGGARGYLSATESAADWDAFKETIGEVRAQSGRLKANLTRAETAFGKSIASANNQVREMRSDRIQIRRIARKSVAVAESRFSKEMDRWTDKYKDAYERFTEQLQYKAPVVLWANRAEEHKKKSDSARFWLIVLGLSFAAAIILFTSIFGSYVADAFLRENCSIVDSGRSECKEMLSPRGPLIVGTILLVSSLVLWLLRMINKIYLSERHLSLDAEEKKAFAETYLALREDSHVDERHEAIVLSALFRPTPDGVVKEDTSAFDPALASLIAKRLSP